MNKDDIKLKITELAKDHNSFDIPTIDEIQIAEIIEDEATSLKLSYCERNGYMINGFPTKKEYYLKNER